MRPGFFVWLYWWRLRAHPWQELLAGAGVAIGVALAFAVIVANGSIGGSSDAIVRSVVGTADWQLASRDSNGTDARLADAVRRLPAVEQAAPILDERAIVSAHGRDVPVSLASIDPALAQLSGRLGSGLLGGLSTFDGVMLTTQAAQELGLPDPAKAATTSALPHVTLEVRGRAIAMPVAAVVGDQLVGPLATAPVAVLPLARMQAITGLHGRATRILIGARPGQEARAHAQLAPIARAMHLNLTRADIETSLLKQALGPSDWTTGFFAAISAMLGFLLAFNAMLLTAPERRRSIADMRLGGLSDGQAIAMVLSQAAILGMIASGIGIGAGWLLAQGIFDASPHYLAPAFLPGAETMVTAFPILVAEVGGVLVCCLASTAPLLDLRRRHPIDRALRASGEADNGLTARATRRCLAAAAALTAAATALLATQPASALAAVALLAAATVCATPAVFRSSLRIADSISQHSGRARMLTVAVFGLRGTTLRSLALAATGAVAVFGAVSISGARTDLLRGISAYTSDYVATADLWIVNGDDNQATGSIADPGLLDRVRHVPGVSSARAYEGSFLDWASRRVWIIARPRSDRTLLPASQLRAGNLEQATERLRRGGWVAISDQLAARERVRVGDHLAIPTPSGSLRVRLAAITTNLGWTPGAITMTTADYRRGWRTSTPSAIEVDVAPAANVAATQLRIATLTGAGLRVQTAAERAAGINASARQGLARLAQISALLLVGAVLAMAAAMGAAIWQRRPALAAHRIHGISPRNLWRVLLIETSIVLGAGCLTGALVGTIGQVGIDQYLIAVTGFPVKIVPAGWQTVETLAFVVLAAVAVVAIPGWRAAQVPPHLGLQTE